MDVNGNFIHKERLTFDHIVGVNVNPVTGQETPTNRLYVYYSKTGTHVVPTLKGEYK